MIKEIYCKAFTCRNAMYLLKNMSIVINFLPSLPPKLRFPNPDLY